MIYMLYYLAGCILLEYTSPCFSFTTVLNLSNQTSSMDHIRHIGHDPWPKEVPYLIDQGESYIYDNGQWSTFLKRVGWSYQELRDFNPSQPSQNPEHTPARAASLLQAYLYFGLLHALTEIPVDTRSYVTITGEGRQVISTACLPAHLELWRKKLGRMSDENLACYVEQLDGLFKATSNVLRQVVKVENCIVPSEVCFSIQVLWRTLISFKKQLFPNSAFPKEISVGNADVKVMEHLRSKGLCTADVQRLMQTFNSLTIYYIGALPPRKTFRNHSNCDTTGCKALQLVNKAYKSRHLAMVADVLQRIWTQIVSKRLLPGIASQSYIIQTRASWKCAQ